MLIINQTSNRTIAKDAKNSNSIVFKLIGLIKNGNKAIFFNTRFGIHTFFLKSSIDLIILDRDNKVVFLKTNIPPRRVVFWNIKYNFVIEAPSNTILKTKTKLNDIIMLK